MSANLPPPPPNAPPQAGIKRPVWKRWWFWVAAVLVLIIAAAAAGTPDHDEAVQATPTSSPTVQPTPSPEPTESESEAPEPTQAPTPAGNTFNDGTWVVGADIKPGTYRASDPGGSCYWERVKNFSGNFNAIIANGNSIGGPIVLTIKKTDGGFSAEGCGEWSDDIKIPVTSSRNAFGDGTYIVGVDIAPGTYRVDAKNGCYWERLRNFFGDFNGIIANDNTKGSTIVQIASSDAGFSSQDCGDWHKV